MVASLDLARLPLGVAQREALRAGRRGFAPAAPFARMLLALRLRTVPLPLPRLTTVIFLASWEDEADLERFRATALRRWLAAERHLALTLRPLRSFGGWRGEDPLAGARVEPGPGSVLLVTHSRTRARDMPRFLLADRPVVRSLRGAEGQLWADGFVDRLRSLDTGTLSLWRDSAAAARFAYGPGVHREAVAAQRQGGWFTESWFARLEVTAASGRWPGLDVEGLAPPRLFPPRAGKGSTGRAP